MCVGNTVEKCKEKQRNKERVNFMRTLTITSVFRGIFDFVPLCSVYLDGEKIGTLPQGKTVKWEIDDNKHELMCAFPYRNRSEPEVSNILNIEEGKFDCCFSLEAKNKTFFSKFKEIFQRGFMGYPMVLKNKER